jgi:hypothetical protein
VTKRTVSVGGRAALALLVTGMVAGSTASADRLGRVRTGPVHAALLIPDGVSYVRGLYVHVGYGLGTNDVWAASARRLGFGHVVLNIDDLATTRRAEKLRQGLDVALDTFAREFGRPELLRAPLLGIGHIAGSMVSRVLLSTPDRVLGVAVDGGFICDPDELDGAARAVPMLFTIRERTDGGHDMLADVERHFVPARAAGLPWTLGIKRGVGLGDAADLTVPWAEAVARLRGSAPGQTSDPASMLRPIGPNEAWLGLREGRDGSAPLVVPASAFRGAPEDTVWMPSRDVARVWRAFR